MPDLDDAPSESYLRELHDHIQQGWPKQRALDKKLMLLADDENPIPTDDTRDQRRKRQFTPKRLSTAEGSRIVNMITALYASPAQIGLMAVSDDVVGDAMRDKAEIALNEVMDQLNPATDSPRLVDVWQQVVLGRTARLGPLQGNAYWWDMPEPRGGEGVVEYNDRLRKWRMGAPLPLVWVDLPAESTFPASWGRLGEEALSTKELTWWDLLDIFSAEELGDIMPETKNRGRNTTLGIYSNRNHLAYIVLEGQRGRFSSVKDKIVRRFEHNLGRSAIRILPGATMGRKEDGKYWRSALYDVASLIMSADRLLTLGGTAIEMGALPVLKRLRIPNMDNEQSDTDQYLAGDVWDVFLDPQSGKAEDISSVFQASGAEEALQLTLLLLGRSERQSGAVEALEGAFGPAGQPAWSKNASIEAAKSKLQPITDGIVAADMDAAESVIAAMREFGEKVFLFRKNNTKIELDPEMLEGFSPILKSEYQLKLPMNKRADWELGIGMIERANQEGMTLDKFWVMEEVMGIKQPFDHYLNALRHQALTSPVIVDAMIKHQMELLQVQLSEELGLTDDQVQQRMPGLPPGVQQMIEQRMGDGRSNGRFRTSEVDGATRAGAPFTVAPGGPQPQ